MNGRKVDCGPKGIGTISNFDKKSNSGIVNFPNGETTTVNFKRYNRGDCISYGLGFVKK